MKVLELFSGTECISNAFRARGHKCFTVDWDKSFPSSLHCDIGKLTSEEIVNRFGYPDVIWAAFDCTTFSVAAISHHRKKILLPGIWTLLVNTRNNAMKPTKMYLKL